MQNADKIFLIGFMGSGKTTAGRKLASHLKWSFIDLDERIEKQAGMDIPGIFANKGETYFRELESKVLKEIGSVTSTVISTGGGTPCFGDNMDFMLASGLTIYIKSSIPELKKRLTRSSEGRPLLNDLDHKDLERFITVKIAEREKWYSRAEITIDNLDPYLSDLFLLVRKRIRQ
jgi:shikimate kinase